MTVSLLDRQPVVKRLSLVLQLLCLVAAAAPAHAQTPNYRTWILAEGAANEFFTEEILIGNPNAAPATVHVTLLPENGAPPPVQTLTVPATSRYTFRVNSVVATGAVGAVVDSDRPIVVERSMYWAYGLRRGGHNSQGVAAAASQWFLAEGTVSFFDTFVLITNSGATPAEVEVTFLCEGGAPITAPFTIPGNGRRTIYVNNEFPEIQTPFSTVVRQTNGSAIVVERAMYWNGFEGGHESSGVTAPNTTWLFAEGATGGNATFDFQTYLLLANPNDTAATVTVDFFRDAGGPVQYQTVVPPTARQTLHLDTLVFSNGVRELANASFSIRVTSTNSVTLLAERSLYWSSSGIAFIDGHNTPGVNAEASKWAFAEGREGRFTDSGPVSYDSYFLFSNSQAAPLRVRGTFLREDGLGIVHTFTVSPTSRFTLLTSQFAELNNQRFAAFFEAVDGSGAPSTQTFVAERAMYWGPGYFGGHGSTGTPWDGFTITPPPIIDLTPTITNVSPSRGPVTGGTPVTITGTNFLETTTVEFDDRPATAIQHVSATQMIVTAPAGVALGAVSVKVMNAGKPIATLANGYTYDPVVPVLTVEFLLGFGDSITAGVTSTLCNAGGTTVLCSSTATPYAARVRNLLAARYPNQTFIAQEAGVPGECASVSGCTGQSGRSRIGQEISPQHDLVVILEGVNDINSGQPVSQIVDALRAMIHTVKEAGKQALICTLTPYRARETNQMLPTDPAQWSALNAAINTLAQSEGIGRVDLATALGGNVNAYISPDGLHPSDAGYQRMAEAIRDKIIERFEVRP